MDGYVIIVMIFGILILGILVLLYFYNQVVNERERVKIQYSNVFEYLKEEGNLILEIITFLEKSFQHEEEYILSLKRSYEEIFKLNHPEEGFSKIRGLSNIFSDFARLESIYPSLKKNQEYLDLKEKLEVNWNRVEYAFSSYDKEVGRYLEMDSSKIYFFIKKIGQFPKFVRYYQ